MDSLLTTPQPSHRRILELTAAIKSTFEPVILTHLYPQLRVDIFVQVQQDGGLLSASISAITLEHITTDIALFDSAPTVSSGVHFTLPLLGLTTLEENNVLHLTVAVVPRTGKVTLVTLETRLHADRFEEIFRLACEAGKVVHKEMRRAVKQRTGALVHAMGDGSTSSVAGVPRVADDDDNDMRID